MQLVLTTQDLEPLPSLSEDLISEPSGFLTSEYKSIVNESLKNVSSKSVFGIRQRIKQSSYITCCTVEVALKISVFLGVILLIFN